MYLCIHMESNDAGTSCHSRSPAGLMPDKPPGCTRPKTCTRRPRHPQPQTRDNSERLVRGFGNRQNTSNKRDRGAGTRTVLNRTTFHPSARKTRPGLFDGPSGPCASLPTPRPPWMGWSRARQGPCERVEAVQGPVKGQMSWRRQVAHPERPEAAPATNAPKSRRSPPNGGLVRRLFFPESSTRNCPQIPSIKKSLLIFKSQNYGRGICGDLVLEPLAPCRGSGLSGPAPSPAYT